MAPEAARASRMVSEAKTFIGEIDIAEFQVLQLRDAGDELQIGIREGLGVGERQASQRGNVFDEGDPFRRVEAISQLQIFQRYLRDVLKATRRGIAGADF